MLLPKQLAVQVTPLMADREKVPGLQQWSVLPRLLGNHLTNEVF